MHDIIVQTRTTELALFTTPERTAVETSEDKSLWFRESDAQVGIPQGAPLVSPRPERQVWPPLSTFSREAGRACGEDENLQTKEQSGKSTCTFKPDHQQTENNPVPSAFLVSNESRWENSETHHPLTPCTFSMPPYLASLLVSGFVVLVLSP